MPDDYDALSKAVEVLGYSTNFEEHGGWHRTSVGCHFWVSHCEGKWFLGVWTGLVYVLPDNTPENRMIELCLSWLTRAPKGPSLDFDQKLKDEYGLVRVEDELIDEEPTT